MKSLTLCGPRVGANKPQPTPFWEKKRCGGATSIADSANILAISRWT